MRHLPDRGYTNRRLAQLADGARHETLTFNPEMSFDPASLRAGAVADRIATSRGVSMRIIGRLPADPDRLVPYGGESSRSRKSYRELADVPMKLFVIDRQVALFPVDPHDYERGYLEVVQTPLVQSLVETFERHWTAAQDPQENKVTGFALTPREEVMIRLLVHGHTDASAAQEMQISERTVSSTLRSLMDRVGVENRFQLGVALGSLRAAPNPPGMSALVDPSRSEEGNR
ncbi:helix-turn-helix transcriptional regulator [Catellatospora methionotrophica]|uniref:helix-turn-helix transcriptional regulator n=1 Tax=Catellatospora methionotrophica TaxID=121620 RepID=UPI0033FBC757